METVARYARDASVPVVIDHMARINAEAGTGQKAFTQLLDLMKRPHVWVKVSAADRASATGAPYRDVLPFMEAVVKAAPERTLWGTDWPHPNIKGPIPSKETLLDILRAATGDAATLKRVLVDNPARLYGF
jgi:2-pyrone-4,6-dicarboxylate lactonase